VRIVRSDVDLICIHHRRHLQGFQKAVVDGIDNADVHGALLHQRQEIASPKHDFKRGDRRARFPADQRKLLSVQRVHFEPHHVERLERAGELAESLRLEAEIEVEHQAAARHGCQPRASEAQRRAPHQIVEMIDRAAVAAGQKRRIVLVDERCDEVAPMAVPQPPLAVLRLDPHPERSGHLAGDAAQLARELGILVDREGTERGLVVARPPRLAGNIRLRQVEPHHVDALYLHLPPPLSLTGWRPDRVVARPAA